MSLAMPILPSNVYLAYEDPYFAESSHVLLNKVAEVCQELREDLLKSDSSIMGPLLDEWQHKEIPSRLALSADLAIVQYHEWHSNVKRFPYSKVNLCDPTEIQRERLRLFTAAMQAWKYKISNDSRPCPTVVKQPVRHDLPRLGHGPKIYSCLEHVRRMKHCLFPAEMINHPDIRHDLDAIPAAQRNAWLREIKLYFDRNNPLTSSISNEAAALLLIWFRHYLQAGVEITTDDDIDYGEIESD